MRPYIIVSWIALPLMALAAAAGLLWPPLYREGAQQAQQWRGMDIVTLFLAVPTLAIVLPQVRLGNLRARVIWLGVMAYVVYTYFLYAFTVKQNELFIVYTALLSLAVLTVAGGSVNARPRGYSIVLHNRFPGRVTAWFLMLTAGTMALLWITDAGVALATGTVNSAMAVGDAPANPMFVIDMAFLIPAYIAGGVLLALRHRAGYLMAGILLVHAVLQGLSVLCLNFLLLYHGLLADPFRVAFFGAFLALAAAFLFFYLRALRTPAWTRFDIPFSRSD